MTTMKTLNRLWAVRLTHFTETEQDPNADGGQVTTRTLCGRTVAGHVVVPGRMPELTVTCLRCERLGGGS